jgi:hypothetical protein
MESWNVGMVHGWVVKGDKVIFVYCPAPKPIVPASHYSKISAVPARHRSRLPARASQWQAGSGEAGGSEAN